MYKKELAVGKRAVSLAMKIVVSIQDRLSDSQCITKEDSSPVTVADFIAQALICNILNTEFPDIPIVAEESSSAITDKPELHSKINSIVESDPLLEMLRSNFLKSIDLGQFTPSPGDTFWTLDPIDGTKGFIRGEQYSVALALIHKGEVVAGILGCPRLVVPSLTSTEGVIFYSSRDINTRILSVSEEIEQEAVISDETDFSKMKFVQSYVSSHSDIEKQHQIADSLRIDSTPVQMDSQVKYGAIASALADIYLRIPHPDNPDYKEKIWDHAAGSILVEQAGGCVSDIFGKKLDFNCGRIMVNNTGILATSEKASKGTLNALSDINFI